MDCADAFVVAIFSERKAPALTPGAKVTIRSDDWEQSVGGTIQKLVPRTTSMDDAGFAVPFPPTERRELYAFVAIDDLGTDPGKGSCQIGKWVSVSLDNGSIPSAADALKSAQQAGSSAFSYIYAQTLGITSLGNQPAKEPVSTIAASPGKEARNLEPRITDRLHPPSEQFDR